MTCSKRVAIAVFESIATIQQPLKKIKCCPVTLVGIFKEDTMPTLTWINDTQARQEASKVPFHLLEKVDSYGDQTSENILVQGDNLLALKALLPFYRGKVKCIYIDPPYNTGSAFEYYDDNLEHSQWLSLMYSRLALLKEFLRWFNLGIN